MCIYLYNIYLSMYEPDIAESNANETQTVQDLLARNNFFR